MIRGWRFALGVAFTAVGFIAACVGSDAEPSTNPVTPAPSVTVTAPPASPTGLPTIVNEDAGPPSAAECADGKVHDFCTSWTFAFSPEALAARGMAREVDDAGSVAELTQVLPFSAPSAFAATLAPKREAPGNVARILHANNNPLTASGRQAPITLSFRVRLDTMPRQTALIGTILLGATASPLGLDLLSIVAVPDLSSGKARVALNEFLTAGVTPDKYQSFTSPIPNVELVHDVWSLVTVTITERGTDNPGAATITIDNKSASPVLLHSKFLSTKLYTWLGLSTNEFTDGGLWAAAYDDVMLDWSAR